MPCLRAAAARPSRLRRVLAPALLALGLTGASTAAAQEPPLFDPAAPRIKRAPSPLLGTYIRLSNKEDGFLNALLQKACSPTLVSRNQFVFEANYNYRLVEGVFLAGSLQYLVNPDQISRQSATRAPRDALVVGLKLALNVNELLGLPTVSSFR